MLKQREKRETALRRGEEKRLQSLIRESRR